MFRTLDKNGDMNFGRGKSDYAKGQDAIKLDVKTRLNSWLNDCFFDMQAGIDWYNRIGSKGEQQLLEQEIKNVILKTDGVKGITSFSTDVSDRRFTASYNVITENSQEFIDTLERTV